MGQKRVVSDLKASSERVGRLYPILVDKHGNVIDGRHRLEADESWPKIRLENVETEEQRLITRLISNACRRHVPAEEKTEMLKRLGEIYLSEGVKPKGIAQKIMERTGMSYRWVAKYLPDNFKDDVKRENALISAARRAAKGDPNVRTLLKELLRPPRREGALEIKKYANTHFVNVIVEKPFYEEFEKASSKLGVSTEISMLKALEDYHEKMKKALTLKKLEEKAGSKNDGRRQDSAFHQT